MNRYDTLRIAADIHECNDQLLEQIGAPIANQASLVVTMKRITQLVDA